MNRSTAHRRDPALDDVGVQTAKQIYGTGLSLRDIGNVLEVHASTVRSALRNAGVPLRDQQGRCKESATEDSNLNSSATLIAQRARDKLTIES